MAAQYKPPTLRRKKRPRSPVKDITRPLAINGTLQEDGQITVQDPETIKFLSNNGCYGTVLQKEELGTSLTKRSCYSESISHTPSHTPTHLRLSRLEAFYLMHNSEMIITTSDQSNLTLSSLWQQSVTNDDAFPIKYISYYNLREEEWVIKDGLKFGVDFLLYKTSPSSHHSTYAVIVRPNEKWMSEEVSLPVGVASSKGVSTSRTTSDMSNLSGRDMLSWKQMLSVIRVNESAAKELVLCLVSSPKYWVWSQLREETIREELMTKTEVTFIVVKRYLPTET